MSKEVNIKITNAKQLIGVLEGIIKRAQDSPYDYTTLYQSIQTLIAVLKEAK